RLRRAPAWDCGFPEVNPMTQYGGGSFAQPVRRVFGTLIFRARERVDMPAPGDLRPAHFAVETHDLIWEGLYLPIAGAVGFVAEKLNHLQFLTIRRYLSLVFLALVFLLLVLALWS
ncbi:hydrogenase 4 subunit B, partial [Rhizobium ruizarguesonis]